MGLPFLACCHQRSEIRSRIMPRKYHSVCKTRLFKNQRRNSSSSSFLSLQHKYNFGKNFINTTHVITTLICCSIFGWGAEYSNSVLGYGKNADFKLEPCGTPGVAHANCRKLHVVLELFSPFDNIVSLSFIMDSFNFDSFLVSTRVNF
jgi:hypothetical protein